MITIRLVRSSLKGGDTGMAPPPLLLGSFGRKNDASVLIFFFTKNTGFPGATLDLKVFFKKAG